MSESLQHLPSIARDLMNCCNCSRIQYHPDLPCICGESPVSLRADIEREKKKAAEQLRIAQEKLKQQQLKQWELQRMQALKIERNRYKSPLFHLPSNEKKSVGNYVKRREEHGKRAAAKKFDAQLDAVLEKERKDRALELSKERHSNYLKERGKQTAVIRLKSRFRMMPDGSYIHENGNFRRQQFIKGYINGAAALAPPTSRINTADQLKKKRLRRLQEERQKEQKILKVSTFFEVVESLVGNPELEKKKKLEKRWEHYKFSQQLVVEAAEKARIAREAKEIAEKVEEDKFKEMGEEEYLRWKTRKEESESMKKNFYANKKKLLLKK